MNDTSPMGFAPLAYWMLKCINSCFTQAHSVHFCTRPWSTDLHGLEIVWCLLRYSVYKVSQSC